MLLSVHISSISSPIYILWPWKLYIKPFKKDLDLSSLSLDMIYERMFWRQLIHELVVTELEKTSIVVMLPN